MKVIVCAVASLALLPAAQSAPEDKKVVFRSLEKSPSQWLSDKPMNLYEKQANPYVDPLGAVYRSPHRPTSRPLLDLPGPGYQRMRGDLPRSEDLL